MTIIILENGPILIDGPVKFKSQGDDNFSEVQGSKVALCRCGNSESKPFCDGSHNACDFNASSVEISSG